MKTAAMFGVLLVATSCADAGEWVTLPNGPGRTRLNTLTPTEVLAVFSAEYEGAIHVAYHVKWHGRDVMVEGHFESKDYKVGDTIWVYGQVMEGPGAQAPGGKAPKALTFHLCDPPPGMDSPPMPGSSGKAVSK